MKMKRAFLFLLFSLLIPPTNELRGAEKVSATNAANDKTASEREPSPSLPSSRDATVAQIQRDLQNIIRIHQSLKALHHSEVREIQRITEQARIHQEILRNLEAARRAEQVRKAALVEEALRQQKILLIQQEAQRNRAFLEGLGRKRANEE